MNNISWFEAVKASVSSCFPCWHHSAAEDDESGYNRPPPHLQSLLANNSSASGTNSGDDEQETLSLHSTLGDSQHRRNKRRKHKKYKGSISFFGFNLFGKRPPPIQLPDDGDDPLIRRHAPGLARTANSSTSSYTFDSDASPLDTAAINQFTAEDVAARVRAAEEEELRAKEERKRRRRERKEMKRMAGTLAAAATDDPNGEFEGFQGSGSGAVYRSIPSPLLRMTNGEDASSSADGSNSSRNSSRRIRSAPANDMGDDEDAEEADLDGLTYARKPRMTAGDTSSAGRSSSDSRTTSSLNPIPYPTCTDAPAPKKPKRSKTSSKRSHSSSGSTQSPSSLASPTTNNFSITVAPPSRTKVDPSFEGVDFDGMEGLAVPRKSDFPSLGLGARRNSSASSGVFLARTGED